MVKHQPPSRIRYFENHPQVNIRLPRKLRDDLQAYVEAQGITLGVLVAQMLRNQKKPLADFREGYLLGYASAIAGERLEVKCCKCGTPIKVSQSQIIEIAEKLLRLRHVKCPCCDEQAEIEISRR